MKRFTLPGRSDEPGSRRTWFVAAIVVVSVGAVAVVYWRIRTPVPVNPVLAFSGSETVLSACLTIAP